MTIEQRLRTTLHAAGEAIDPAAATPELTSKANPHWRSSPVAFAVAFVSVVVAGLVVVVLLRPTTEPSALPTPPAPLDVSDVGPLSWRSIDVIPDNVGVAAVVNGPAGWLLVGYHNDQTNGWTGAPVLSSDDAVTWTEHPTSGFDGVVHIDGLVGTESQYLAYGLYAAPSYTVTTVNQPSNFPEPAVWTSVDGTDWNLTPLPLPSTEDAISSNVSYRIRGLASDGETAVAVGVEFDENVPEGAGDSGSYVVPTRQVAWHKAADRPWELVDAPEVGLISAIVAGPAGVIAAAPDDPASVWLWNEAAKEWRSLSVAPRGMSALVSTASGYLALADGQLWFSTDATQWAVQDLPVGISSIAAGRGGFVAASDRGAGQSETGIWWSPDAQQWRQIAATADLTEVGFMEMSQAAVDRTAITVVAWTSIFRSVMIVGTTS